VTKSKRFCSLIQQFCNFSFLRLYYFRPPKSARC